VADQIGPHDRSATDRWRRLGQLLGLADVRASGSSIGCGAGREASRPGLPCVPSSSCAWTTIATAHEIGTTRVSARFEEGRYAIEIYDRCRVADREARRRRRVADGCDHARVDAAAMEKRLVARRLFPAACDRRVRWHGARPTFTTPCRPHPMRCLRRCDDSTDRRGAASASQFTWSYSWTFASYALSVTNGDAAARAEWLEGGQTSAPILLTESAALTTRTTVAWRYLLLGFTHIIPHGLDHMLSCSDFSCSAAACGPSSHR
jgi:hypothetical protein